MANTTKCPTCGGSANNMWLVKSARKYAEFIVECWSGDINKETKRHYWKLRIRLAKPKTINSEHGVEK